MILKYLLLNKSKFCMTKSTYDTALQLGVSYLNMLKKIKNNNIPQAVMFDIDDTLLKVNGNSLTPIHPIIELLNYSKKLGFIVIIVTARDKYYASSTEKQLHDFGIVNYINLHMRDPRKDNGVVRIQDQQIFTFKSDIKKEYYTKYGIQFVMSVGDNLADIIGDYSGYYLKLPDHNDPNLYHLNINTGQKEIVKTFKK
jgi:predicted secreted acid phosphatase